MAKRVTVTIYWIATPATNCNLTENTMKTVNFTGRLCAAVAFALLASAAQATGFATCESGPRESWQPEDKLAAALKEKGWQIRRIKEDGGCYEVYALDEKGQRVEAYFHPRTLAPVPHGAKNHKG
jgi:hypothetical protein